MSKKNREAYDFWNKVSVEQGEMQEMKTEQYAQDIAHNKEGISADKETLQMGITTIPKVHPARDQK